MRNNTTNTQLFPPINVTAQKGGGMGQNAIGQVATQSVLDWRLLVLIGVILSIAFTLIATGMDSLRHVPQRTG